MERMTDTLDWLYSLEARGEIYKLDRMDNALALIGNPHRKLRAVHIAGTKGKGSVAAMLDAMLRAGGYRVGLYTKPHLVHLTERTRINGTEMPAALMLEYIIRLRDIYERAGLALTFFEFTVALMFLYFAEAGVEVAVIETGLGGRLDSTNVVHPLLSVITPIGFDHMDRLGYTIAAIAGEKGGIIKEGVPVVIGARDMEARLVLTSIASQRHAAAFMIDREFSYQVARAGPSPGLSRTRACGWKMSNWRWPDRFSMRTPRSRSRPQRPCAPRVGRCARTRFGAGCAKRSGPGGSIS